MIPGTFSMKQKLNIYFGIIAMLAQNLSNFYPGFIGKYIIKAFFLFLPENT